MILFRSLGFDFRFGLGLEKLFSLIDHEFTIENNMMTPSMKVRRFKVKEMYGENLEKLY